MDSLTQITLGAAMGEAVLGKKVGNRAMLWGAIGGTIPDLDVFANLFLDEIDALAFHRSITHSLLFAVVVPFVFGRLTCRFYQSGIYRKGKYKATAMTVWLLLLAAILFAINVIPWQVSGKVSWPTLLISVAVLAGTGWLLWRRYYRAGLMEVNATATDWAWLFFWSIFTHPLLDSCTPYGTQLFQPFSDYRVAFNNISVVDPLYTVPFMLCLMVAAWLPHKSRKRAMWNWLGIGISTAWLLFTFWHKHQVNRIFAQALQREGIAAQRYMTAPTILNNWLWQGLAEGDTAYYQGDYSFFDPEPVIPELVVIPKGHHLLAGHENDHDIRTLRWFSKGYFNVIRRQDGRLQLNDLRFGSLNRRFDSERDYVFRFVLEEVDGELKARQTREGNDIDGKAFEKFVRRIKGYRD